MIMMNDEPIIFAKDLEYLFLFNPNKMTTDEIVNYINSCSNGSDRMFIYNSYYFMLKQIPGEPYVLNWEKSLGDKILKESAKRELIVLLKYSSTFCDVWLSPQEKFINYLRSVWQELFTKIKPKKYEYVGHIYTISKREISGWVINRLRPKERVMVDIYGDYEKKISVCADIFREDLKQHSIDDGFHAFCLSPVPEDLLKCSNITVKTQNAEYSLIDNYLGIFRKHYTYQYYGHIYTISLQEISGWVIDTLEPDERVMLDIYGDDEKKLSVCANLFREDLKEHNIDDGFHAFCLNPVPQELLKCSNITVKTQNGGYILIDEFHGIFRN